MTDRPRDAALPRHAGDEAAEAAREARHAVLAELLAVYADGELPPETMSQLDAHLVGCASCRRELTLQTSLRRSLAEAPVDPAPVGLRERIVAATAAIPPAEPARAPGRSGLRHERRLVALAALAVVSLVGAGTWAVRAERDEVGSRSAAVERLGVDPAAVPLLAAVAADYGRVMAGDLPGRARDLPAVRAAVAFPVEPLHAPALRLLAAWTTEILGEPTAVLAYRWDDRLVVQYIVPEHLFFRHPSVRSAMAAHRVLATRSGASGLVAFPVVDAGSLLVGEGAPERLVDALGR